ncbi:MAG: hypothetical protein US80_C0011G0022 [Candidatus Daviesbacteria bacterium GW2011_GWA2_38_17]|uniref:Uncharacterized protein n=1 Tax=Candidatus Daviesbacteria bacterium GW2011_GWF2_38_6 TaxID=1618432 RepID=A0A0G0MZ61_9BACT|nr:MAG: hypothetical protein US80_C0011G0022 [Candidatus Daviesbacteria bacterium GW2011_GWA2_38_17]KKQ78919.1 MAG: hypothetical protein US99_C0008G0008 [Candidatus Daviesbacteria bacterium GW2011_GWF2_38_6]
MLKECYQLKTEQQTPCFIKAGSKPCSGNDCPVANRIQELTASGTAVSIQLFNLMLHSICRISSLSFDNREYRQRTNQTS